MLRRTDTLSATRCLDVTTSWASKPGFCKNRPPWMNESDCGTRGDRKACVCTCSKHPGSSREDQVDRSYARSKYALFSKNDRRQITALRFDFSAARRPLELILGSMGSRHTICWSCKHKNDSSRVEIQSDSRYRRYIRVLTTCFYC